MSGVRDLQRPLNLQHIEDEGEWALVTDETAGSDE